MQEKSLSNALSSAPSRSASATASAKMWGCIIANLEPVAIFQHRVRSRFDRPGIHRSNDDDR
jgi:hypothetical protein